MKRYYYGIVQSIHGIDIFAHRKRKAVPLEAIIIEECLVKTREEVLAFAQAIKISFVNEPLPSPGDVVIYADQDGQHTAIVLFNMMAESCFVFVTTNPHWGIISRELSKEEQILLGFPDRGRKSYFTPVIRDNNFAVATGKQYPLHRVESLRKEFQKWI